MLIKTFVETRNLLSDSEIKAMVEELKKDSSLPVIKPPDGRDYWSVYRIVATLEYFQEIEKKYNRGVK